MISGKFISDMLKRRVYLQDLDVIAIFCGSRGSGKSTSCINWGWQLDRDKFGKPRFFLPDEMVPADFKLKKGERLPRVVFKLTDFLKLITEYNLPAGSCIVLEEASVVLNSREAMSRMNRALVKVFDTIRSKNLIVFINLPSLSAFDKQVRACLTYYVECSGLITFNGKKYCKNRFYTLQHNPRSGKNYTHLFRTSKGSLVNRIENVLVSKPPEKIDRVYKRWKEYYQKELYSSFNEELSKIDDFLGVVKPLEQKKSLKQLAVMVAKNYEPYFDAEKNKFIRSELEVGLEITSTDARYLKELLDNRYKKDKLKALAR